MGVGGRLILSHLSPFTTAQVSSYQHYPLQLKRILSTPKRVPLSLPPSLAVRHPSRFVDKSHTLCELGCGHKCTSIPSSIYPLPRCQSPRVPVPLGVLYPLPPPGGGTNSASYGPHPSTTCSALEAHSEGRVADRAL